jgi:aldehyde:ferredoxin oxidoreductase
MMEKYVGGTGVGAKFIYEEVPPGVEWNDSLNCVIAGSGGSFLPL